MSDAIGLIIGSGFAWLDAGQRGRRRIDTPYGESSSELIDLELGGQGVTCLIRHGEAHRIAPHEVNYRANVWAMHAAGVRALVAVNVVGAIAPGFLPGQIALPDQIIDYTHGRASSFGPDEQGVRHIDFTEPFDPVLRGRLAAAAQAADLCFANGVYGVTQGPRLETAAEIDRLERDGCTMVGMTAMPEAALARELELPYAIVAVAVNHAAGRSPAGATIHAELERYLGEGMQRAAALIEQLLRAASSATM